MTPAEDFDRRILSIWIARGLVGIVFALNLGCAFSFLAQPERYAPAFELEGTQGRIVVQAFGLLFLMWNATYPPVLLRPRAHLTLLGVAVVQQTLGLAGETWLWSGLPSGHLALWNTGLRFIVFDGAGLALLGIAFMLLKATDSRAAPG